MYTDEDRRMHKVRRYHRLHGRPFRVTGEDQARATRKVRSFYARGMSMAQLSGATGIPRRTFTDIIRRDLTGMSRRHWQAIMAVRFEPPDDTAIVSSLGTVRRLGALAVEGFPLSWMVAESGFGNHQHIQRLLNGKRGTNGVTAAGARKVSELYDRLDGVTPEQAGIGTRVMRSCRTYAARNGHAPRHCWDPDTLDDPHAIPEWTGACGTPRGARIHLREGIPMCPPCAQPDRDLPSGFQAQRFRRMREDRGWSQRYAAAALGTDRSTLAHWEGGFSAPRPETLEKVLEVFGVSREHLIKEG